MRLLFDAPQSAWITLLCVVVAASLSLVRASNACGDVSGSYGDLRETGSDEFANLVGVACGGACFDEASRWSQMASLHGNHPVNNTDTCRKLCRATTGCDVWTFDTQEGEKQGVCKAMNALAAGPTLGSVENTTSGSRDCPGPFLPFPDSLQSISVADISDPCYRPGYLYADSDGDDKCIRSAPLLEVRTTQKILDQGVVQGWWDAMKYESETVTLTPIPSPYSTALECSKACVGSCGGFTMTHGVCFLRGNVDPGGMPFSADTACRSINPNIRQDVISGPSFAASQAKKCSPIKRTVPSFFENCATPRCIDVDVQGGSWESFDLDPPFPADTKDFAFKPKNNKCFFPVFNRSEIRSMTMSSNSWIMVSGGSNSYGAAAAIMKAIHPGITETESTSLFIHFRTSVVDTIRYANGTRLTRSFEPSKSAQTVGGDIMNPYQTWPNNVYTGMQAWLEETERAFAEGSVRVTFIVGRYYTHSKSIIDLMNRPTVPWKKMLFYAHVGVWYSFGGVPNQMTQFETDLTDFISAANTGICSKPENLCFLGSPAFSNNGDSKKRRSFQMSELAKTPHVEFIDYFYMGTNNFEMRSAHGLQSFHVYIWHMMLNMFDLTLLDSSQKIRASSGCPEALQLPRQCHSADGAGWDQHCQKICDFKRDEITPLFGLPMYYKSRKDLGSDGKGNVTGDGGGTADSNNCGVEMNVYNAIQRSLNMTPVLFPSINTNIGEASSCKRIWCGSEYQAWGLGQGVAISVAILFTLFKCHAIAGKTRENTNAKSRKNKKEVTSLQQKASFNSLDPGNGGRRNWKDAPQRNARTRSVVQRTKAGKSVTTHTNKCLSTIVGERLTGLGPARFMASMHIVTGHMYQKGAIGKLIFLSWGYTWVPWFFMLSGYVLMHARLHSRKPDRVDSPSMSLWKRTASIFPMYSIGVVLDMLTFIALSKPLPNYHVLIAQSFLVHSWVTSFTEKALQTHCWFLSSMVVYWICFGPAYRQIRFFSLKKVCIFMAILALLPWLAVIIPASLGNLSFYSKHRTGSLATSLDHLVVFLKFHPLAYAHVFLFGMCLSRFRSHITRREDSYEVGSAQKPLSQSLFMIPFRAGATLGYIFLIIVFLSLREASAAEAKISARVGLLMPFQGLILLGLSPFRGLHVEGAKWQWGADPIANVFKLAPGWIGDVSYSQYVFQILAYTVWPIQKDVFGRLGWIPFFAFLQSISFVTAMTIQTPARRRWMKPKQGRWMLFAPALLATILCLGKYFQNSGISTSKRFELPSPYMRLSRKYFWDTTNNSCTSKYGSYAAGENATLAVDVQLNWSSPSAKNANLSVINPSILLHPVGSSKNGFMYKYTRAARLHRMDEVEETTVLSNSKFYNGSVTIIRSIWESSISVAEDKILADFSSWDPTSWNLDGARGDESALIPIALYSNQHKKRFWGNLCKQSPRYVAVNKTLFYTEITGPEDPKLISLPNQISRTSNGSQKHWGMLFSSYPPEELLGAKCQYSSSAVIQMYLAKGGSGLFGRQPSHTPPAGVRIQCGKTTKAEKNWIPFTYNNQQYFVYSIEPHIVLIGRPADGACAQIYQTSSYGPIKSLAEDIGASFIRGSATAVRFGPNRYLALFHTSVNGQYSTMAYMFAANPPFEIKSVSRPIPLLGSPRAFASSLTVLNESNKILISYGVADAQSRTMVLSKSALRDLFTWQGCSQHDLDWWAAWDGNRTAAYRDSKQDMIECAAIAAAETKAELEGETVFLTRLIDSGYVVIFLATSALACILLAYGVLNASSKKERELKNSEPRSTLSVEYNTPLSSISENPPQWFVAGTDEYGNPISLGPFSQVEMQDKLREGSILSLTWIMQDDGEWVQAQNVDILPKSNATEWYILGDDGMMEGPFKRHALFGWYATGAVAEDILVSNGGDWTELHELFSNGNQNEFPTTDSDAWGGYYIYYGGDALGPYPSWTIREWLRWGDIDASTMISSNNGMSWKAASDCMSDDSTGNKNSTTISNLFSFSFNWGKKKFAPTAEEGDIELQTNPMSGKEEASNRWIEAYDENGNEYYWNEDTGETSWVKPS